MKELQTILGIDIPLEARGIVYLAEFDYKNLTLTVIRELFFRTISEAWQAYANIPNPESQMVSGKTYDELITNLHKLHIHMKDKEWLEDLADCL